jgi:hypothetical protein
MSFTAEGNFVRSSEKQGEEEYMSIMGDCSFTTTASTNYY